VETVNGRDPIDAAGHDAHLGGDHDHQEKQGAEHKREPQKRDAV